MQRHVARSESRRATLPNMGTCYYLILYPRHTLVRIRVAEMPIDPNDPRLFKVAYAKIQGDQVCCFCRFARPASRSSIQDVGEVYVRKFEVLIGRTTKSQAGTMLNANMLHARFLNE